MIEIKLTKEQAEFINEAIDCYIFAISNVISYDEMCRIRSEIINPIYDQMPDIIF